MMTMRIKNSPIDSFGIRACVPFMLLLLAPALAVAQSLTMEEYEPKSTLVVREHLVPRAKYPFIDIHSHQQNLSSDYVDKLVKEMDSINLQLMVNLSGGTGERL